MGVDIEVKPKTAASEDEGGGFWNSLLYGGSEEDKTANLESPATVKTGGGKSGMSFEDIYSKLDELNQQLQVIASNSTNMSNYVNELRSGGDQGVVIGM